MPLPEEGQWVLDYSGVSLVLGSSPLLPPRDQRGFHLTKAPVIGETALEVDDSAAGRKDGMHFGQDFRAGRIITFELGLKGTSKDDVVELYSDLLAGFRGDPIRQVPGTLAKLSTRQSGRLRAVYGRPRHASADHTFPRSEYMLGNATFQTVDDLWYGVTLNSIVVPLVPGVVGGMAGPLMAPLSVTAPSIQVGAITVGGVKPAYPIVTINGPIANPIVELINEWKIQLNYSIATGTSVIIDTRPWAGTVILSSTNGSLAGKLARSSWLERALLYPGGHTVALRGNDVTGTASMTFAWSDTYVTM